MDNGDDPEGGPDDEKDCSSGSNSLSGSLGSSQCAAEFRRQMLRPPNKKKHDEEVEELVALIRAKDTELKSLGVISAEASSSMLREIRAEKEASISKRKKIDNDLRLLNQEITRKMGQLSRTESNLHYKNEAKIDDAIHKMEWQLQNQNFRVSEERRIVAEVDKLKRSKKVLVEYFSQKKDVDKLRENQRRMRGEREHYYRAVTGLNKREEDLKKTTHNKKTRAEECKKELDGLYERKRQLLAEFRQSESDFNRQVHERKHRLRKESFKKREEERRAKEDARQRELLEYQSQCEPFEDEKNLCNTLISYLHRYTVEREDNPTIPSPRDEQPHTPFGSNQSLGPADSLDDGKFVLLKKSEDTESDYTIANKPRRRSKKDRRKLSVTKPLAHTPQIIAQFSSLNLSAPSNMSEVAASIEQLHARKRYYEQQAVHVSRPLLGSLSGSFSSSGSMSGSLDSPLRERASTWSFVEVPPAIAENQTPSDAGTSGESGFHDMSRQASKTESSESTAECAAASDMVLDELIKQNAECGESETSRSSSDTITPEEQLVEETEQHVKLSASSDYSISSQVSSQGNTDTVSKHSHDNDSQESAVFEEAASKTFTKGEHLKRNSSGCISVLEDLSAKIVNYDADFPPVLQAVGPAEPVSEHCDHSNVIKPQSDTSSAWSGRLTEPSCTNIHTTTDSHQTNCASNSNMCNSTAGETLNQGEVSIPSVHIREPLVADESRDNREDTIISTDQVTHL